jgi:dipeptidyl aminopeptidase/acylaminoacyl peptidase
MRIFHVFFLTLGLSCLLLSCQTESMPPEAPPREVPTYSIEQFMDNVSIGVASFGPEGQKLLVGSDQSGIPNAYALTLGDSSLTPLTQSEGTPIRPISYFPDDERVLLTMDDNGDEIYHLYVRRPNGRMKQLTSGKQARASFLGWSHDGSQGYFTYTKRDPRYQDLYVMDAQSLDYEMIYQNDEGYYLGEVSPDGEFLALIEPITTSQSKLYLHHLPSGTTTQISTETGDYSPAYFHPEQPEFYFLTNAGSEFKRLVKFNYEERAFTEVAEREWDIVGAVISHEGSYQGIAINEDGRTVVEMTHLSSGKAVELPNEPGSSLGNIHIARDETQMTFKYGPSNAPQDLYHMTLPEGKPTQIFETLNPPIDADDLVEAQVVRFRSFDGKMIPAIYYRPHQASAEEPVPGLVWVHGGPGGQSRQGYSALMQYLVNHGYAVLAVNNRGSSGYGQTFYNLDNQRHGEEDLQDCIYGKKWMARQPSIDGDRIGILGGSYGGFMVMAALTREPEAFDVGVDLFGVTNWLRTLKGIPDWWEAQREALYAEMGNPYEDSARLYEISPLFHADQIVKPVMVLQGAQDPRVIKAESDEIVAAVKENGVPVEYVLFEDEGHGFSKEANQIEAYTRIEAFLDQYLKGEETEKPQAAEDAVEAEKAKPTETEESAEETGADNEAEAKEAAEEAPSESADSEAQAAE